MATLTTSTLVDDLDGSTEDVSTIRFNVPVPGRPGFSTAYSIDLSATNQEAFRRALQPYIDAARFVTGVNPDAVRPGEGPLIRAWAETEGISLKPGRIPHDVIRRYRSH